MKKQKLSLLIAAALLGTSAFAASFPQDIQLCINVKDNTSPHSFGGKFVSTDIFDLGTKVRGVRNGISCSGHHYKHGPKNIKLEIGVLGGKGTLNDVKLLPDQTCLYMQRRANGAVGSNYTRMSAHSYTWNVTLTQAQPMNGVKYAYFMHCEVEAR